MECGVWSISALMGGFLRGVWLIIANTGTSAPLILAEMNSIWLAIITYFVLFILANPSGVTQISAGLVMFGMFLDSMPMFYLGEFLFLASFMVTLEPRLIET